MYRKKVYGKNRSVIISINKSATLFKCSKPPSFQNKSAKVFPSRSAKQSIERSARHNTDSSVTPTSTKSIPSKMKRIIRQDTRRIILRHMEQDCGMLQENQLETMNDKLSCGVKVQVL